ncbi:MAG: squalene--hopene cyclase [Dehalococcoidia bacterium]|nr:squalene--hopene cyclase [Dehalococcoidia bacterium]
MATRTEGTRRPAQPASPATPKTSRGSAGVDFGMLEHAIKKAQQHLLGLQSQEGYWVGELEADASVAAGYIPLMHFMQVSIDPARRDRIVSYVKSKQGPDGSWSTYYGGPGDLSVTVQAYFALKLAGVSAEEPLMQRAREFVVAHGGLTRANVFTKIWLALFGQYPWRGCPSLPPEIILMPNWLYFNIYEFASWSRATIVALMVVATSRPVCPVPEHGGVSELYTEPEGHRDYSLGQAKGLFNWRNFFLFMDSAFKTWDRSPLKPGRGIALRKAARWIMEHQEADGSWAGIMLPWIYSLIALKCLGYPLAHPAVARGMKGLDDFIIEDGKGFRLQPATSPVWDTAWAVIALNESALASDDTSLVRAARWLLRKEIRVRGDWRVKNSKTEPGCWSFEFENNLYPDIDDTAVVPRALLRVQLPDREEAAKAQAIDRGLRCTLSMQSNDGGWAAFDLNNNKKFLAHIPFADFMSPLDPTCPDVTAHVLELLADMNVKGAPMSKALSYLQRSEEPDGAWYGRWGVNYVYGTGLALSSLAAAGQDLKQESMRKAVDWLVSHQNQDGGWGETCHTYDDPGCRGTGPSTASQTAWALLGLAAAGEGARPAVERGVRFLLTAQQADGSWAEDAYTGTGFPGAFYLRYDLYRMYFPLMALARCRRSLKGVSG